MNEIANKLQTILEKQIGKGKVYNIVAAVQAHDRSIDFVGSAGIADALMNTAMAKDTPYFIASVSKMYTAMIVMRLFEDKCIDLDAPISKYLPASNIRGIHVYKGTDYSDQIKVSELISHTSGLADYEGDKPKGGKSLMDELKAGKDFAIDTEQALKIVRTLSPRFVPGKPGKAYYSNTNYRLLGSIIESITEKPMATNIEEMISAPLGLQKTYLFDWTKPRTDAIPATAYIKKTPADIPKYLSSNTSDGGLVSTASECLIFLRAFFEGKLFNKALLDRMMNWNSIFFPLRYGYGLMYYKLPQIFWPHPLPEFIGHSGSTGSFAYICPSRSLYIAGTVNQVSSPARPFFLMKDLVRATK